MNATSDVAPGPDTPGGERRWRLPIDPSAAFLGRRALAAWLARVGWPLADAEDLVLAVDEAISNSVEHGYRDHPDPGPDQLGIELAAHTVTDAGTPRRVRITITDRGSWEPPTAGPSNRRRGLALMRNLVETVEIASCSRGTRITLISRPA